MELLSYLMVLGAATLWGGSGLFITYLTNAGLSGLQITVVRMMFVPLLIGIFLLLTDKKQFKIERKDALWYLPDGFLGIFCFNLCYTITIQRVGMGTAAVLLYLMPSFVMLFSVIVYHERFTLRKGICLGMSLLGCALVSGIANGFVADLTGILTGLCAAVFYSLYSIVTSSRLNKYSPFTNIFYTFLSACIGGLIYGGCNGALAEGLRIYAAHPDAIAVTLALAVMCSCVSYWFFNTALKHIPASHVGLIATFEPVAASLLGFLILGDAIDIFGICGIICEFSALILFALPERKA